MENVPRSSWKERVDRRSSVSGDSQRDNLEALLRHALMLDLEVSQHGKILKIGAVLGGETFASAGASPAAASLRELARLAASARCVLGHNLIRHDLAVLRETTPDHPLLRLPVIDTLVLSPIAFPENPYHRLVKDYKLVRESLNDPVADARQAATLFGDEFRSLDGLRQTESRLFRVAPFPPRDTRSWRRAARVGNGDDVPSPGWNQADPGKGIGTLSGIDRPMGLCPRAD